MDRQPAGCDQELRQCGDEQLIAGLMRVLERERSMTARLVAFMGEVDARGLYRKYAYSSMFEYAVSALHMSEGEAYVRIHAARACRAYPVVLEMLACGELHLSGVRLVAPVLTAENHRELLGTVRCKSKREIERLLAGRFPKPDVRNEMRKLPEPARGAPPMPVATLCLELAGSHAEPSGPPAARAGDERSPEIIAASAVAGTVAPMLTVAVPGASALVAEVTARASATGDSARVPAEGLMTAVREPSAGSRTVAPAMTALRDDRYKVQFTAGQRLHDKIKQAQHLLRHQVPDGDLAQICERALDSLIAARMKQRFAVGRKPAIPRVAAPTKARALTQVPRVPAATTARAPVPPATSPARAGTPTKDLGAAAPPRMPTQASGSEAAPPVIPASRSNTRYIPNEVRRQVLARDGSRCAFVSELGRRCEERGGLEFHHKRPFARGGEATVGNVCLLCRAHNAWLAERDYGRAFMQRRIAGASAPPDSTRGLLTHAPGRGGAREGDAVADRSPG